MLTIGRAARLLLFASALLAVLACSAGPPAETPAGQATKAPRPTATPGAEPFTAARPDIGPVSTNPPGGIPSMTEIITVLMAPREAVRAAAQLAQWPAIPQFGTLIGEPDAVFGRLLIYREAWKYYSDGAMDRSDLLVADNLVWLIIFEGEIYGKCDQPGCSHLVGRGPTGQSGWRRTNGGSPWWSWTP